MPCSACAALCSHDLRRDVARRFAPREAALRSVGQTYSWIEMRPRDRTERENERYEHCASCERIGEQRDRNVSACEAFTHDARSNDRHQEKRRTRRLGDHAPC